MAKKKVDLVGRDTAKRGPGKFKERVKAEAKKQGVPIDEQVKNFEDTQAKLPGTEDVVVRPKAVQDGCLMADYVRPHYGMEEGNRFIELEFSFPLEQAHRGYLPKSVEECWTFINKKRADKVDKIEVGDQTIDIHLVPDDKAILHLSAVPVTRASLSLVEATGSGAAEKVIRYLFRVRVENTNDNQYFADNYYGANVWLECGDAQGELQ
jgi:hypothetical protein